MFILASSEYTINFVHSDIDHEIKIFREHDLILQLEPLSSDWFNNSVSPSASETSSIKDSVKLCCDENVEMAQKIAETGKTMVFLGRRFLADTLSHRVKR